MAYEMPAVRVGFLAADVDMSAQSFAFSPVWLGPAANTAGYGQGNAALVAIGSLTGPPLGILQAPVIQGEAGLVVVSGASKCKAGGTWAIGDPLGWNAGGTALIKAVSTKYAIGTALENAVVNDISTVLLIPRGIQ
jgi:hypothetical protein